MPNVTRGGHMGGLLAYLVGAGRADEHRFPHLVAADETVTADYPVGVELAPAQALSIARRLDRARRLFGVEVGVPNYLRDGEGRVRLDDRGRKIKDPARPLTPGHVWHCSLSLSAEEGELADETWGRIATAFMSKMGFTADSSGRSPARWAAVRHGLSTGGNDHIHIVASTVRDDGTKVDLWREQKRSQRAVGELEHEFGLQVLESRDTRIGTRGLTRAELLPGGVSTREEPARWRLERVVRACAVASREEGEFVRRLRQEKLIVLPRYAHGDTDAVVGYAVAEPTQNRGRLVYYGGGRLASDLTLPALRNEWDRNPALDAEAVGEWRAAHRNRLPVNSNGVEVVPVDAAEVGRAAQDLQWWNRYLAMIPPEDRAQWARAAARTAGVMAAWSVRTEPASGPLAATARALAKSAQRSAHTRWQKPPRALTASGAALIMLQARQQSTAATYQLVLAQLARAAGAIRDAHIAMGDLHRAAELDRAMQSELAAVHAHYTPVPVAEGGRQTSVQMQRVLDGALEFGSAESPSATRRLASALEHDRAPYDPDHGLDRSQDHGHER
ncbi:relaxase/mobilization nuclease domain-containing protein [Nocardia sp. NPDC058705]|uniref:relaxase/mobilization nuclease domain-containing protein n=1 Tax=Nocardia sp. NPDC058705 TaxID=3346609 RepID=UPI0036AECDAE